MQRKLTLYAALFGLVVFIDGVRFLFFDGTGIINWNSPIHLVWVIVTLVLLSLSAHFFRREIIRSAFLIHFLVFTLALLNQYFSFSSVLTYNCMLFNLVFVSIYYLLVEEKR